MVLPSLLPPLLTFLWKDWGGGREITGGAEPSSSLLLGQGNMSTSGEPSRWGAESSWPYRSRFLSLEEKKGRHSPVPGYRLPDGPCRQCGVAGKKASGLNEGGKSSLLLMVEGQPCAPSPPGQHDHCHPTVLFTTAAWKDLVPPLRGWRRSLLQSSPRLRMEAALTPVHPVESRCSEWPLRDQQWACYTWGRHSVLPATSPDTCGERRVGREAHLARPSP